MSAMTNSKRQLALVLLCLAQLMCIADISIVNIALPSMRSDLKLTPAALQWVISAYNLAYGGFLLIGGRLGDLYGRRRLFRLGLTTFALASAMGGVSVTAPMLLWSRALQGIGGAIISPAVLSLITHLFPEGESRNRAVGALGAVSGAGFALGLVLGGVLTSTVGWRWVFFINLPVGLGVALLATKYVPETGRTRQPLLPPGLFRYHSLIGATLAALTFGMIIAPQTFIFTLYVQNVAGFSPISAGISFLPSEIVLLICAGLVGRNIGKFGMRNTLAVGVLLLAASMLLIARLAPGNSYYAVILPSLLLSGLAIACVQVAGSLAATAGVPASEHGVAAGVYNTGIQIGSALGMSALIGAANTLTAALTATISGPDQAAAELTATLSGYHLAAWLATAVGLAGMIGVLFLVPKEASKHAAL